nr:MAG TPA_asm: hypothetical protein [Caudoviricetes sp.]
MTPMPITLLANFDVQAIALKTKMFSQAPNTHETAMKMLSKRNKRLL